MDDPYEDSNRTRRRFLLAGVSTPLIGLAGCIGSDVNFGNTDFDDLRSIPESAPSEHEWNELDLDADVPESARNCVSPSGDERDPGNLEAKSDVAYQTHASFHQQCANCRFFCRPEPESNAGACTEVEGVIASQHWCALWEAAAWYQDPVWHEDNPR